MWGNLFNYAGFAGVVSDDALNASGGDILFGSIDAVGDKDKFVGIGAFVEVVS